MKLRIDGQEKGDGAAGGDVMMMIPGWTVRWGEERAERDTWRCMLMVDMLLHNMIAFWLHLISMCCIFLLTVTIKMCVTFFCVEWPTFFGSEDTEHCVNITWSWNEQWCVCACFHVLDGQPSCFSLSLFHMSFNVCSCVSSEMHVMNWTIMSYLCLQVEPIRKTRPFWICCSTFSSGSMDQQHRVPH